VQSNDDDGFSDDEALFSGADYEENNNFFDPQ